MATTPVEFPSESGRNLSATLFALGSDTKVNGASGDSATEKTNRLGLYSIDVTEALTGWHEVSISDDDSGEIVGYFYVYLEDTTTIHRVRDIVAPTLGGKGGNTPWYGSTYINADILAIDGDTTSPTNLKQQMLAMIVGTVQTAEASANTDTVFDTNLPLEAADYYGDANGGLVIAFISGTTNQFQSARIIASATGTANTRITLETALDATPVNGDTFIALGRITEL